MPVAYFCLRSRYWKHSQHCGSSEGGAHQSRVGGAVHQSSVGGGAHQSRVGGGAHQSRVGGVTQQSRVGVVLISYMLGTDSGLSCHYDLFTYFLV